MLDCILTGKKNEGVTQIKTTFSVKIITVREGKKKRKRRKTRSVQKILNNETI